MDPARGLSRIGQENPSVPFSPELDDQLFQTYFNWTAYQNDTEPWDKASHRATPQHLNKLITDIPSVIDSIESHRFFRMPTSFDSEDGTVTSDYSGHPSPPELVLGEGSTSPSDHSGPTLPEQAEDSYQRHSISLKDFQAQDDHWTYPQTNAPKSSRKTYASQSQVPGNVARRHIDQGSSFHYVPPGPSHGKRSRQLENPDQTADVRKSGACLPCRISKTRCHESGVCPTCRKAFPEHSHLVCARKSLIELWPVMSRGPDLWSKNPAKESDFMSQTPRVFTGKPRPIAIFFSRERDSPALSAFVQAYRWRDEDEGSQLEKAAFCSDCPPQHPMLQQWVESQIRREGASDFPLAVRRFLMEYSREGSGLPKDGLVHKVHQMGCFFRIWKTSAFWCRDPSGKIAALPISVQAQLRTIALRAIRSYEHDILKELDNLTTPSHQPKQDDRLALWASLWQLILMYRELTGACRSRLARPERSPNDPHAAGLQFRCKFLFDNFFPLVTIFYHYQFRTKGSVEVSLDWIKSSKDSQRGRCKAIEHAAKALLDCRKQFLQSLQSSKTEVDRMLCVFVVNHELKKLNARKRPPKGSKSKASAYEADDDCEYEAN